MKIGRISNGQDVPAFQRDSYELHYFTNGSGAVLIRSASDPMGVLLHLLSKAPGPVALLYVLLLARRRAHLEGRYESPYVTVAEAAEFIQRFGMFLQGDGRHEFWIHCPDFLDITYDRHERIWAYGNEGQIEHWIRQMGIEQGTLEPIPVPHSHHYHPEFDAFEDQVMAYWPWQRFPLQDQDGD